MPRDALAEVPAIKTLVKQFETVIPKRFGPARAYPSGADQQTVIRSDCSNTGCGVRVTVHVDRNPQTFQWEFVEKDATGAVAPQFSRLQNAACGECKELAGSPTPSNPPEESGV